MSERTKIPYCNSTANFWTGCTKVSAGCANCYAEAMAKRFQRTFAQWGPGKPRKWCESAIGALRCMNKRPWVCDRCSTARPCKGHVDSLALCPCGAVNEQSHRRRVFINDMSDWLDPEVPIEWLARMLDAVRQADQLEHILCSKRWENCGDAISKAGEWLRDTGQIESACWVADWIQYEPPPNLTLLCSIENQETADERIPDFLKIPAARRGLSIEPMLGPVDLSPWLTIPKNHRVTPPRPIGIGAAFDWLIIGGESGPSARPCNIEWIRSLVCQGQAAGVAVFVKQLGFNRNDNGKAVHSATPRERGAWENLSGSDPSEWPEDLRVREWPKEKGSK